MLSFITNSYFFIIHMSVPIVLYGIYAMLIVEYDHYRNSNKVEKYSIYFFIINIIISFMKVFIF